mmetsp:Transcript_38720/g.102126  ORF Transcript_38720/g.102126 Transcript_38720/m.102126 type:complete len:164 (+) Transcript_38720:231-722(+)
MMYTVTFFTLLVASVSASCGTTGGGTRPCVNNPFYTCTDCGPAPCAGSDGHCYSCYGANGMCYPYYCTTYCSTAPCTAIESIAFSEPLHNETIHGVVESKGVKQPLEKPVTLATPLSATKIGKTDGDTSTGCCAIVNNKCCPPGNACEQSGMACSCSPSQCSS